MSTIWFDPDDDPTELVTALEAEGYAVRVHREEFAGEEDPPQAVGVRPSTERSGVLGAGAPTSDRSLVVTAEPFDEGVEALVDVYGGWLPGDERLPNAPAPDLPDAPRRLKNP